MGNKIGLMLIDNNYMNFLLIVQLVGFFLLLVVFYIETKLNKNLEVLTYLLSAMIISIFIILFGSLVYRFMLSIR
ncbi:hypothetical protein EJM73_06620 [Clostridium botulinum]|uniref:Uncharacterized protein n=1 Tax=Clostridium sporogenes TaxID=1509 RepID=A0A7X5PE80_CLOSG|nr:MULTISPECIES: hypothetical protein [Clostridium]AJD29335.1 putative membrane protein [Clostridium botulinum Prevot_594]NCI20631.1 hypothetical protein [Clostridium botulinum]NCI35339.1 hypothetical protein [Clostridium botulinum]NCI72068.1 hypothetical protein [Clostridium botulinum]NDI38182.1 hypothetical protein [Clostridium botulinum]